MLGGPTHMLECVCDKQNSPTREGNNKITSYLGRKKKVKGLQSRKQLGCKKTVTDLDRFESRLATNKISKAKMFKRNMNQEWMGVQTNKIIEGGVGIKE